MQATLPGSPPCLLRGRRRCRRPFGSSRRRPHQPPSSCSSLLHARICGTAAAPEERPCWTCRCVGLPPHVVWLATALMPAHAAALPTPATTLQNMQLHFSLAPDAWPLLQRLQSSTVSEAALQAHLLPGSSCSRGLHVQLAAAAAERSITVRVGLQHTSPASDDALAAAAAQQLEVAVSRAPAAAGLAHMLSAAATAHAEGASGLKVAGTLVTAAPIIDFRPLLPKRLAATNLAQRLQEQLRSPMPPLEEVHSCLLRTLQPFQPHRHECPFTSSAAPGRRTAC